MAVIAGEEQMDRLSFVSLTCQIDASLKKGYKEWDAINTIICAISPSLKLRSYLETMGKSPYQNFDKCYRLITNKKLRNWSLPRTNNYVSVTKGNASRFLNKGS